MEGAAKELAGAISDVARQNAMAARRAAAETGAGRAAQASSTPTRPAARSCSACARSTIVGHGASGPDGVANAVRLAARSEKVDAVGRTAALLREGGAGRAALAGDGSGTGSRRRRRENRPMERDEVITLVREHLAEELEVDIGRSRRAPASRRTSTPTRSTSTSW